MSGRETITPAPAVRSHKAVEHMEEESQGQHDALGETILREILKAGITDPDEFEKVYVEAITEGVPAAAKPLRQELARDAPRMIAEHAELEEGFRQRLYDRWKPALDLLYQIVVIAEEMGEEIHHEIGSEQTTSEYVVQALIGLHVRGCQVAREVICLLRGGFAAGALSRWRTLHELSVVAVFIAEHGEGTAERYLLHAAVTARKDLRQYQQYSEDLGFEPEADDVVARLQADQDVLRERFGKSFLGDYGWAADALGNNKPSFVDLAEAVDLAHWRPFTRMANDTVHAGSKALTWSLGVPNGYPSLHSGASNYGLADPGQLAAYSLVLMTTSLAVQRPTVDRLVMCQALVELTSEAAEAFVRIQREIEAEEETIVPESRQREH